MDENKEVILTQEGFNNLEKELEYLKTEKRAEVSERIKIALGFRGLIRKFWIWWSKKCSSWKWSFNCWIRKQN